MSLAYVFGLNTSLPPFNDQRVRQAVGYAIDRERIVKQVFAGYGDTSSLWWSRREPGWDAAQAAAYRYDPARAKAMLRQAGAAGAQVTIDVINTLSVQSVAQIVRYDLEAAGLRVATKVYENVDFSNRVVKGALGQAYLNNVGMADMSAATIVSASPMFTPSRNPSHFDAPEYDAAVDAALTASAAGRPVAVRRLAGLHAGPGVQPHAGHVELDQRAVQARPGSPDRRRGQLPSRRHLPGVIMNRFLVRRIPSALLVLFATSVLAFVLPRLAPGDPAVAAAGPDAGAADIAAIRRDLGLDRPLVDQYFHWMGGIFTGDFGRSYATDRSVTDLIGGRLDSTMQLAVLAAVFMVVIGVALGVAAGSARRRFAKSLLDVVCSVLLAVPPFLTGLLLVLLLGVFWTVLPVSGEVSVFADPEIGVQYLLLRPSRWPCRRRRTSPACCRARCGSRGRRSSCRPRSPRAPRPPG